MSVRERQTATAHQVNVYRDVLQVDVYILMSLSHTALNRRLRS